MNALGTKTLETERLILRKITRDDADDMFHHWASDSEITKFLTWPAHKDVEATKGYVEFVVGRYDQPDVFDWGIELKSIGKLIGTIGVVKLTPEVESAHIGYCLGKKWWHQGIMSEAFQEVIRFLFDEVELNRIDARFDPRNIGSGKVMEKCGLQYEGTMRSSDKNNQGICDAAWYSILKTDRR